MVSWISDGPGKGRCKDGSAISFAGGLGRGFDAPTFLAYRDPSGRKLSLRTSISLKDPSGGEIYWYLTAHWDPPDHELLLTPTEKDLLRLKIEQGLGALGGEYVMVLKEKGDGHFF